MNAPSSSGKSGRSGRRQRERALGLLAVALLFVAWVVGASRAESDLMPALRRAWPAADHFERVEGGLYAARGEGPAGSLLGYVGLGSANGYGGPLTLAVATGNPNGEIVGISVAGHRETSVWMDRVSKSGLLDRLIGKSYRDRFELGEDLDGVTSATYTSRAVAGAARNGSRAAARALGLDVAPPPPPQIRFGIPEMALIALFAAGFIGHRRGFRYTKQVRWATMVAGMLILGFLYNQPLTLASINRYLLGYWPPWQTHLYWYLLIGGMLFVFTVDDKNPYCQWFCPFGATQECLGVVGGAKIRSAGRFHRFLKWVQRGLAWTAIFLALLTLNPGVTSYEIFGAFFSLLGSNIQFLLLGIVLLASMFIRRPWCNYLCPVAPVTDLYRTFRIWVEESWKSLGRRAPV